ncbi:MAG: hypothetical protein OEW68_16060 [Gammaproteobacteria bacterium]|nr:hypothetical protein [Gammaproteobacteria bacterium]MDH4316336.1 hypothetical protein [Gammaproteobacteria bacterium]MDH5215836.1 hypothetical protein [Gammaproteobacteria bacterium]MDH5501739.1 hypothetical protein [Gammaproteobacteria bacterium]
MHESILAFRKRRYLWLALLVSVVSIAAYWIDDPQEPANGGTVLGYALGTAGALLIVWLAWFGVRKRRYASTMGTVQGWLSAHVYLGLALVLVVLLHTGFQFGYNVHTAAFALMMLVVVSGLFGVYVYLKYPQRLSENRGGVNRSELIDQIEDVDTRSRRIARQLPAEFQELVSSGISRLQFGNSMWARLRARDLSQVLLKRGNDYAVVANPGQEAALDWLADQQSRCRDPAVAALIGELSGLLRNKRRLLKPLIEDFRMQAMLEIWLFVHVPLTAGLLVALLSHILAVFVYW